MTWCFRNKLLLGKLKDTKNGVKSIFLKNMVSQKLKFGKNVEKNTARRQIDSSLDLLSDNELKIIQGTIDGILNSRENKK